MVNVDHVGQPGSSSAATAAADDNVDCDYITVEDLLQDMAEDDSGGGDGDGEEATMGDPRDVELFEQIANRLDHDDVLFGSPRWLENFRETKEATIDPLYKDCSKQWTALRFNL
jgi:hypothetical protein